MEKGQTNRRLADRIADAPWYAGLLNIRTDDYEQTSVLDIGGGPLPLAAALEMDIARCDVLDPVDYTDLGAVVTQNPFVSQRFVEPAEWFKVNDGAYDECWGYNVLQHVIDPEKVIETAKRAARVVRWLDWVNTPVHEIHPHSIGPNWLRTQFGLDWNITFDTSGSVTRPGWSHEFIAIVAERAA